MVHIDINKLEFTSADKTVIRKDWLTLLPEMKAMPKTRTMEFCKVVGPLAITVTLKTRHLYAAYVVVFQVYNLATELPIANLAEEAHGNDYSFVHWNHHKEYYPHAFKLIKKQAWLPLEGPFSLDDIFNAYSAYAKRPNLQFLENYEESVKVLTETYDGDEERVRIMLEYGDLAAGSAMASALIAAWGGEQKKAEEYFEWACKVHNFRNMEFREKLEKLISNPEALRQTARANRVKYKFDYAPCYDLVGIPYKETWHE